MCVLGPIFWVKKARSGFRKMRIKLRYLKKSKMLKITILTNFLKHNEYILIQIPEKKIRKHNITGSKSRFTATYQSYLCLCSSVGSSVSSICIPNPGRVSSVLFRWHSVQREGRGHGKQLGLYVQGK